MFSTRIWIRVSAKEGASNDNGSRKRLAALQSDPLVSIVAAAPYHRKKRRHDRSWHPANHGFHGRVRALARALRSQFAKPALALKPPVFAGGTWKHILGTDHLG